MLKNRLEALSKQPRRWLVTGAAGFIGSNLVEALLHAGQTVVGLDDFSTGKASNLEDARARAGTHSAPQWTLVEGDVRDPDVCDRACRGVDFVLHHAALVSVPQSLGDPGLTNEINVGGFVQVLESARRAGVRRVVYASSSAVYGEGSGEANREDRIGEALSPYALTKQINELYGAFYTRVYGLPCTGLRYFNVFGPRQDPMGAYAAVVPRWAEAMAGGNPCLIFGDGTSTRDFCPVQDVIQANILAATAEEGLGEVFNVGSGQACSLLDLYSAMASVVSSRWPGKLVPPPRHEAARAGDIKHSSADIRRIRSVMGFEPSLALEAGLELLLKG